MAFVKYSVSKINEVKNETLPGWVDRKLASEPKDVKKASDDETSEEVTEGE